jgi:hypothetical protein
MMVLGLLMWFVYDQCVLVFGLASIISPLSLLDRKTFWRWIFLGVPVETGRKRPQNPENPPIFF